MSKQLARTVANAFNRQPAMLALAYADVMIDTLNQLSSANAKEENDSAKEARSCLLSAYGYETVAEEKPFAYADGLAFIPITGLLINRFSWSWSWVTGYNFIREQLNAALADEDVKLIVFDCNSGGGQVAGCFELAADIYASRSIKPSVAVVDAASYSACYALASSATKVVVTPSGGVGSIGVVAMHIDYSKMLQDAGIKVTFIYSGDHKVDGNPYESLPKPVQADIQKSVDTTRKEFVTLVSRNRSLDPKIVFDTQAACFSASEALDLGLIDAIAPPLEAVRAFFTELSGSQPSMEIDPMTTAEKSGTDSQAAAQEAKKPEAASTETKVEAAAAATVQTEAKVDSAAVQKAERERIAGITGHEAAADKPKLASHLAMNTDMSVEDAAKVLAAAAPEQKEASASNAFAAAMETTKNPEVGADAAAGGGDMTAAQRILASQAVATGVKH